MKHPIYTSVSNANVVSCGRKGETIKTDPIPLLKNNYLGEYRTELEKAKVRKNLGIADESVMEWGNITGHIEDNADLREAFSYTLPDDLKEIIKEDFTSIKGALSWAIEYISHFVSDSDSIIWLKEQVSIINTNINSLEQNLTSNINTLQEDLNNKITDNSNNINEILENISEIENSIISINSSIEQINKNLNEIDIEGSITDWINLHSSNSIHLKDNQTLEVRISNSENNAITVEETGLFVPDLSKEVTESSQNIENLQTNVNNILNTYVTKEELGGDGDFNFVKTEDFQEYTNQTENTLLQIDKELSKTVKTGEDGHVNTLYVNQISNEEGNIKITQPFEAQSDFPLDIRTIVKSSSDLYKFSPDTSYVGMTVANIADGNIYMLVDKSNITNKSGWRASYESIQIIACTKEEYELWLENTNEDFQPKDETLSFIHSNTYYYIYEDENSQQYYVTKELIEGWLKSKANVGDVELLQTNLTNTQKDLNDYKQEINNNYLTAEKISEIYYNKEYIDSTYYTKQQSDNIFVTKESLRGDSLAGEDDFVFVTQNQYNTDKDQFESYKESVQEELNKTLKTGEDGSLETISLNQIKSSDGTLIVDITSEGLSIDNDPIVTKSTLTRHVTLPKSEYENMVELGTVEEDVYYYTYEEELSNGFVTQNDLRSYYLKSETDVIIADLKSTIQKLTERIETLENL